MQASAPNEEAWWWNIVAEISKWHKFMLNQLHSDNCCLLLLSSKNQMSRRDLLPKHQLPCSKSLAGCSPCSRRPAAAWAELLRSPAGWWPARSRSSCWPEPPSCGGTGVNITARHRRILKHRRTYLDSSSRSLPPPVNCSFLRCQFISWICFLVPPPPRNKMTVKHTKKNGWDNIFCKVEAHLNFWSSFWAISIMNAKLLKEEEKLRG